MNKGMPPIDEERLPWLEPYREQSEGLPIPAAEPKTRGGALAVGVVAAIGVALTAGYYMGQRDQDASDPTPVAEAPVMIQQAPARDSVATDAPPAASPVVTPAPLASQSDNAASTGSEELPQSNPDEITSGPLMRSRDAARQRALTNLANERARLRARRFAEEQARATAVAAATTRPAGPDMRSWPKMPSPGPAGQVVQLGAFRTEGRAMAAYRSRLSRYPVLGSMPRVVVPVMTKPRGQVLYVLRLGTSSRQQSRIVCRNLKASGDHCIVIG